MGPPPCKFWYFLPSKTEIRTYLPGVKVQLHPPAPVQLRSNSSSNQMCTVQNRQPRSTQEYRKHATHLYHDHRVSRGQWVGLRQVRSLRPPTGNGLGSERGWCRHRRIRLYMFRPLSTRTFQFANRTGRFATFLPRLQTFCPVRDLEKSSRTVQYLRTKQN